MPTPHISAKKDEIAKLVIMPGDPVRAKFFAKKLLKDAKLVSKVRGIVAYTGKYKNKKVSIIASGIGMPSMGIYAYELFKFYDVEKIIRVGTCGAYKKEAELFDIIVGDKAITDGSFDKEFCGEKIVPQASQNLLEHCKQVAKKEKINLEIGTIKTSSCFYHFDNIKEKSKGAIAKEMECFALYLIAQKLNKEALTILTVSDKFGSKKVLSVEEREQKTLQMAQLALETIIK